MKKQTIGVFAKRVDAERAINHIHNELSIPNEEISYLYRNTEGDVKEVPAEKVATKTPAEGATTGAKAGAVVGALGGIAAVAGMIPAIGPIFAAGPFLAALGITGAVGTTAAGAVGGAAVGSLVGALVSLGVGKEKAQKYEDRVMAGDVLVAVHSEDSAKVEDIMSKAGVIEVETYSVAV